MERKSLISRILHGLLNPLRPVAVISGVLSGVFKKAVYRFAPSYRQRYWEGRAAGIDEKWGRGEGDYPVLAEAIASIRPERILDVGCGSGRLFPLYHQLHIPEVVGQDISDEALGIATGRYPFTSIVTTNRDILSLKFFEGYFDLVISNRVLQHVQPGEIARVLEKLATMGKHLYINELTDSDGLEETFYMFRHDYRALLERNGFAVASSGRIGKQTWYLFGKKPQSSE
jgi:2-polyprenyl-3-methyl-5-hydroxy-6-metoxy-1,4-benzoquinol methylase